jgi:hypothetical protein
LLNKEESQDTGVDNATEPVTPEETGNGSWEDDTHDKRNTDIIAVLPDDNWVLVEIRNVGTTNAFWVFFIR